MTPPLERLMRQNWEEAEAEIDRLTAHLAEAKAELAALVKLNAEHATHLELENECLRAGIDPRIAWEKTRTMIRVAEENLSLKAQLAALAAAGDALAEAGSGLENDLDGWPETLTSKPTLKAWCAALAAYRAAREGVASER